MTITQTIEVPADRRIILEVPREVPTGTVILTFTPASPAKQDSDAADCPLCAGHRDPKTGELCLNAHTKASMQEVDDMLSGKIPNKLKQFNSLDEMLEDLDSDD